MLSSTAGDRLAIDLATARTSADRIWRSSARGCTVMPREPAAMIVSTAASTLGTSPPLEFRSVATLLTFTDKRIMTGRLREGADVHNPRRRSLQMLFHGGDNPFRQAS